MTNSASASKQKELQSVNSLPPKLAHFITQVNGELEKHPVIWLQTPPETTTGLITLFQDQLPNRGHHSLIAGLPAEDQFAFGPIRTLLRTLIACIENESPDLLAACAPELVNIMPELAEASWAKEAPPLESLIPIPLGLARMLPRQSEFLLRIVTRLGWFITQACQRIAPKQKTALLLFPQVDQADRPTLYTIYHLFQRARLGNVKLLLMSEWSPEEELTIDRKHLFDTEYEQWQLLTQFYQQLSPTVLSVDVELPSTPRYAQSQNPIISQEAAAHLEAQTALADDEVDRAETAVYQALSLSNQYFNIERMLLLVENVLSYPRLSTSFTITLWKIAGSAHAALGNYPEATTCFQNGYALTDAHTPLRAQMAMYLALVSAKRVGAFDQAIEFLERGYQALEHLETPAANLERGWLNNVNALIAYRKSNYRKALNLTQEAIQFMKPYRDEDALGLKTNLVTNVSILFESANQPQKALDVWQLFKAFLGEANDLFDKHYLCREAGLSLKAGLPEEAMNSYQRAFATAVRVGDLVGIEATARAIVYLAHQAGDYQKALDWARHLPPAYEQLGDDERLWRSWRTLAACYYYVQDLEGMAEAHQKATFLWQKIKQPAEPMALTAVLPTLHPDTLDKIDWGSWLPEPPDTILRWSPRLIVP